MLQPSASNGYKKLSDLLPPHLTCVTKAWFRAAADTRINAVERQRLRPLVVFAIAGLS